MKCGVIGETETELEAAAYMLFQKAPAPPWSPEEVGPRLNSFRLPNKTTPFLYPFRSIQILRIVLISASMVSE